MTLFLFVCSLVLLTENLAFDLAAYRANDFYEAQERSIFESRFPVGTRVFVRLRLCDPTKAEGTVVSHHDGNRLRIRTVEEEHMVFAGNVSLDPDKD